MIQNPETTHFKNLTEAKTFRKEERLKSKKLIEALFESGKSIAEHPFRILWLSQELPVIYPAQVCISVPKKNFARSVDRNRIKRQIREIYRLNKGFLYQRLFEKKGQLVFIIIFTGKDFPAYAEMQEKIKRLLTRLTEEYEKSIATSG